MEQRGQNFDVSGACITRRGVESCYEILKKSSGIWLEGSRLSTVYNFMSSKNGLVSSYFPYCSSSIT